MPDGYSVRREQRIEQRRQANYARLGKRHSADIRASILRIDPAYQRKIKPSLINDISFNFEFDLFGEIYVSHRADDSYYVIDGQHRLLGFIKVWGIDSEVPCWVYEGLSREEEARIFSLQGKRKPLAATELFRAAVVSGEPERLAINELVDSIGLKIASSNNDKADGSIRAVRQLEWAYHSSPRLLEETLILLVDCYGGRKESLSGEIIAGLFGFMRRYHDIFVRRRLVERLGQIPISHLIRRRSELSPRGTGSGAFGMEKYMAQAIVEVYNYKLRENRLPDWRDIQPLGGVGA